jgi:DNA-binding XRE family transcriptional regulator
LPYLFEVDALDTIAKAQASTNHTEFWLTYPVKSSPVMSIPVVFMAPKREDVTMRETKLQKVKNPDLLAFGLAVRKRRKELGYSQEAFGDVCDIDRSYMGGIERGEYNLSLVNILKIVRALKLEPSEFFKNLDQRRIEELLSSEKAKEERTKLVKHL